MKLWPIHRSQWCGPLLHQQRILFIETYLGMRRALSFPNVTFSLAISSLYHHKRFYRNSSWELSPYMLCDSQQRLSDPLFRTSSITENLIQNFIPRAYSWCDILLLQFFQEEAQILWWSVLEYNFTLDREENEHFIYISTYIHQYRFVFHWLQRRTTSVMYLAPILIHCPYSLSQPRNSCIPVKYHQH